jgi:hypothetical protein
MTNGKTCFFSLREPAIFSTHAATEKGCTMPKSSRLIDQSTDIFPFNQQTYDRVTNEFETVERRFRNLQHAGNEEAKHLGDVAAKINGLIWELWSAVVRAENGERKLEEKDFF